MRVRLKIQQSMSGQPDILVLDDFLKWLSFHSHERLRRPVFLRFLGLRGSVQTIKTYDAMAVPDLNLYKAKTFSVTDAKKDSTGID